MSIVKKYRLSYQDRQRELATFLAEAGYTPTMVGVLQPIDIFLELSGEDIRRRIFVTTDQTGREFCLRPEFTIPICLQHSDYSEGRSQDYSYFGPVFRLSDSQPNEFLQAGIESIGRDDIAAADAEILGYAIEGLRILGQAESVVHFGDMKLTVALLDAIGVPPAAKRRTMRALAAKRPLSDIATLPLNQDPNAGLLTAIQGQDPAAAQAFVENILSIAGISRVGGRNARDIAERFLNKATINATGSAGLNPRNLDIIGRYKSIQGQPDDALSKLRTLVRDIGTDSVALHDALKLFEDRIGFMEARNLPVASFNFSGSFARNLDYYTGFIFEISSGTVEQGKRNHEILVGGGRYDTLMNQLGNQTISPAVGCAFWLDRIVAPGEDHA